VAHVVVLASALSLVSTPDAAGGLDRGRLEQQAMVGSRQLKQRAMAGGRQFKQRAVARGRQLKQRAVAE
jgi:hypothetical protein